MDLAPSKIKKASWLDIKIVVLGILAAIGLTFVIVCSIVILNSTPKAATSTMSPSLLTRPKVRLALFATGLPHPTDIVSTGQAPDTRLFALDQAGIIRIVNRDGTVASQPFLDISSLVTFSGEMGLLGLAFSPHYSHDGYFFINYIDKAQNTIIASYHLSSDPNKADVSSGQTLLTLKQPYPNHNGGDLHFGPDGYLYAALGDGGSAGDPQDLAQNLSSLFGKILRLDVSQVPYKVPPTNPFINKPGTAPEIWDYGLRNPWRISFDSKTGDLYIADVGQATTEEVDIEAAGNHGGNNYGWRCFEGNKDFNLQNCQPRSSYIFPVLEYDHSQGRCSITGGYVYRGQKYPALEGKYFYADYCNGDVYETKKAVSNWQSTLATKTPYKITTFGVDGHGELYAADAITGSLYQFEDSANPAK